MKGFLWGVLLGPWLWAGAIFTIWGLVTEMRKFWHEFEEWAAQHDDPPASRKVDADELVVRAILGDLELEDRYPWLTDVQRQDILRRRRQETK